jgi:hypothetical protein
MKSKYHFTIALNVEVSSDSNNNNPQAFRILLMRRTISQRILTIKKMMTMRRMTRTIETSLNLFQLSSLFNNPTNKRQINSIIPKSSHSQLTKI